MVWSAHRDARASHKDESPSQATGVRYRGMAAIARMDCTDAAVDCANALSNALPDDLHHGRPDACNCRISFVPAGRSVRNEDRHQIRHALGRRDHGHNVAGVMTPATGRSAAVSAEIGVLKQSRKANRMAILQGVLASLKSMNAT